MRHHSFQVSLSTLQATSCLLGHELEDRTPICNSQDLSLFKRLASRTACTLRSPSQRELFCVAPLDILVTEEDGRKQFHLLELNGTGIGGLTNMPAKAVNSVLGSLTEFCSTFTEPGGVVLLAVSGKEYDIAPRLNRLMHEKLLFADAMLVGLEENFGSCNVATLAGFLAETSARPLGRPTLVVGYIKELLGALTCDAEGGLWLGGRHVAGAVNDRFCRNVIQRFQGRVDLRQFKTLNRCFVPGSDKGVAYSLVNDLVQKEHHPALPNRVCFTHAHDRDSLVDVVLTWLRRGRRVVIKPDGTGLGHGIEFFLDPEEARSVIVDRIDRSLRQTEEYYDVAGGALPYTVCEFVDACRVSEPGHRLEGHKYELRVVVYRDGDSLKAVPSIAKVARERASENRIMRRSLINNITASGDTHKVCGTDYMLPLCNQRTFDALGLTEADMQDLCRFATALVQHTLNQIEDVPECYGLPGRPAAGRGVMLEAA